MEPAYVVSLIILGLGSVAYIALMWWSAGWQNELNAVKSRQQEHEKRLNAHDVQHATIRTELTHIKDTVDETHDDVKALLRNGNSSTG